MVLACSDIEESGTTWLMVGGHSPETVQLRRYSSLADIS